MGRYRSRSRSYSPRRRSRTPPRGRKRYYEDEFPRDRYRGGHHRSPAPSGLLVRNLPLDARPEDLRAPFEKYGPVKDVYLPKNYYTGEPRGFGFVKFRYAEDAAEAKHRMDHKIIGGREIRIVYAEENRKTPQEMRTSARISDRYGGGYRGTPPPRSTRRQYDSYSRSPSPAGRDSRERGVRDDYSSPDRTRYHSRSYSPQPEREYMSHGSQDERGYGPRSARDDRDQKSNQRSPSTKENGRLAENDKGNASGRSNSRRGVSHSPSRSHSQSYGPH